MPDKDKENTDQEGEKWITVGGKKIKVDADEEAQDKIREKLPSARGVKESATKEAQKAYVRRHDLIKTPFKPRDEVVFDDYKKSGIIQGIDGDMVKIFCDGRIMKSYKNDTFKKSELIGEYHWDTLSLTDRTELLKSVNLDSSYNKRNWGNLPFEIRTVMKDTSPAGTTTATTGLHNPVYNPINEEKPVSQRIKDEISRQKKFKSSEDIESQGDTDEKKGKD